MSLTIVHDSNANGDGASLLQFALANEPIAGIVLEALCQGPCWSDDRRFRISSSRCKTICALPVTWNCEGLQGKQHRQAYRGADPRVIYYAGELPFNSQLMSQFRVRRTNDVWYRISNGRFSTKIEGDLLQRALAGAKADLVAVNVEPGLLGAREKMCLTPEGDIAGFRRVYADSAEFALPPADWPHHLFIKAGVVKQVLVDGALPLSFSTLCETALLRQLNLRTVNVGGTVFDLETERGILGLCRTMLPKHTGLRAETSKSSSISRHARLTADVLLGENVDIGPDAVVIGPAIIGNNVKIERGAVVASSIIGPQVCVPADQLVRDRVVVGPNQDWECLLERQNRKSGGTDDLDLWPTPQDAFRKWPRFSYARCLKRIADCAAALFVLSLFAPVMPFIALAIKLTSPGPVFYADKRQGLHGKEFGCLKFRTMVTGADKMQDKLRFVSQVDGPQFKMEDDPRISTVGRFLRETYIDEIPQFFNVLFGQMSIVGPRPSPASENTLCPSWRDARLSVRPGITGLWQLHRTREPMKDFQEWIYYDTTYVRNLSLKTDLTTCWQTALKLLDNFIGQF